MTAVTAHVRTQPSLLPLLDEGMPDARGWMTRRLAMAVIAFFLVIVPLMLPGTKPAWVAKGYAFVIIGLSINMLIGYAGLVSLGHSAFVGVGAFTSALLITNAGMPFYFTIFAAMATGAVATLILGLVALRLKNEYLALVTLAYGAITEEVIFGIPTLTGGGAGVQAPRPEPFTSDGMYAVLCLAFVGIVMFIDTRFVKSQAGRAVFAVRDNQIAAASFGVNTVAYKLMAFILSGAMAGLGGALLAGVTQFIAPSDFTFALSLTFVLMAVVGGLGSRGGIFVGSMFFAIFPLYAPELLDTLGGLPGLGALAELDADKVVFGIIMFGALLLLLTLTRFPGGIGQQIRPLTDWLNGRPFSFKHHDGPGVSAGGGGVRP